MLQVAAQPSPSLLPSLAGRLMPTAFTSSDRIVFSAGVS